LAYTRVTLATLDQRLIERCGDNNVWWTEAERRDAINEAISCWQAMTGNWTASYPLTADGSFFYAVPKQLTSLSRVSYNGAPLTLISLPELDYGFAGWESAAAAAPMFWAPSGINEFAVYPAPAGGIFTLDGFTEAPWLSAPGSFIDMGDEDLVAVLQYAHHFLTFKEAGQELEATKPEMQAFMQAAAGRNGRLRATTFYRRWAGLDRAADERPDRVDDTPSGARA
jgi:hypothetical protein